MAVTLSPADYNSWKEVRDELMQEAKAGLKAQCEAEIASAGDDTNVQAMRDSFMAKERALEHDIDHKVHNFSATLDVEYNFLSS